MSIVKANGAGESGGFYNGVATQGLRLNDGASQYLSRTPSSAGNRRTFTFSAWIKRAQLDATNVGGGSDTPIISAGTASVFDVLRFVSQNFTTPKDILHVYTYDGSADYSEEVNRSFRDTANWYNIVWAVDTTQSTAGNRIKYYVNGTLQTAVSQYYAQVPQNYDFSFNSTNAHWIGRNLNSTSRYFDGYLAEVNFVDGLQLAADNFGQTKNNIWIAKNPDVSDYGTNGFRLQFKEVGGSANSSGIGADTSGKGNHFTPNNINGIDSNFKDCPENNFCTMNELDAGSQVDLSNGNLGISWSSNSGHAVRSTFTVSSGKWYMEFLRGTSNVTIGIAKQIIPGVSASSGWIGSSAYGSGGSYSYSSDANKYTNGSNTSYGATYSSGDVIGVAFDADNGTITFYKNGSSQGQAYSSISGEFAFGIGFFGGSTGGTVAGANFGQDSTFSNTISQGNNTDANGEGDFKYSVPTGHIALCTKNLADPTIGPESDTNSTDHHNTVLYSGNGSNSHAITGVGHQPDWLWIKRLDGSNSHVLQDSTRGKGSNDSFRVLLSNADDLEYDLNDHVRSFDSDGFTLDDDTDNTVATNNSGQSYVAWSWKLNAGTTSTNNDGSLTSTVQANTTSGVSIMTYTGGGSAGDTIGHGLGKAPTMVWFKRRGADGNWMVYVKDMGSNGYINLDRDNGKDTGGSPVNNTDPSSSVITLGSFQSLNSSSSNNTYIAYAFASIDGFSKVGNYTGNGSSDGPFVFLGFRPAWILVKNTSNANNWALLDDTRIGVGVTAHTINPVLSIVNTNTANAEFDSQSYPLIDILSNGFKIRVGGTGSAVAQNLNRNDSDLYIYLAFAHQPFKFSNGF